MLQKDGTIVISNFHKLMAESAYFGFEEVRNLDVLSKPGVARVNPKLKKASGTVISGYPRWIVKEGSNAWCIDDDGEVYKETGTGGITWAHHDGNTKGSGNGFALFKDYLIEFKGLAINAYPKSGTGSGDWLNSTFGGSACPGGSSKPTLVGQDGILYIGDGRYVLSIAEVDGKTLDPADPTTYTAKVTSADPALDLEEGWEVVALAEKNEYLVIGAYNADLNQSNIFYWNRSSSSFELPVIIGNDDIHTLITVNNLTYVIAGINASIYVTNGSDLMKIGQLPDTFVNRPLGKSLTILPDAICFFQNKIMFATSYRGNNGIDTPALIWSFTPAGFDKVNLQIEHQLSSGNVGNGGAFPINIASLLPFSDTQLMVGFEDGTTDDTSRGIDITDITRRYTSYNAYVISEFYNVGSKTNPRPFENVEIQLVKALATGEGIKIYYRTTQNGSWTTLLTFDTAGKQSYQAIEHPEVALPYDVENIQFKVALTTPSGSESTPELEYIKIY